MSFATKLTSRRGAWATLVIGLLLAFGLIGGLKGASIPSGNESPPVGAESSQVTRLQALFPDHDIAPVLLVVTRADGAALTPDQLAQASALGGSLPSLAGHPASPALPSPDGKAAIVQVPMKVDESHTDNATTVTAIRAAVAERPIDGTTIQVTGGPAFGADIAKSFEGANIRLLLATIGIVALLLILTYRSPILFLVPLAVVGVADQAAAAVTAWVGQQFDLRFDAGVVSVLVFGAGANYALLLISRYREELHREHNHRSALAAAWRATTPAIVASNLTVVLALASLLFASIPSTRGLGVASAIGLLIALAMVLLVLPAALAICGRRIFWPFEPKVGDERASQRSVWGRIAAWVQRRPVAVVVSGLLLLAIMAAGLLGTSVGLTAAERFRTPSESGLGLTTLSKHFPAGMAEPLTIITKADRLDAVEAAAKGVKGVTSVRVSPARSTDGSLAQLSVITDANPGSEHARELVTDVRAAVHGVPRADALVGGQQASDLDARIGQEHDLKLVAPIVLGIIALVLLLLLRSIVAPLILLAVNAFSALATIGAGSWVGTHLLGWPALDLPVPLLAFLFLVALGIDYTIFLVHRARSEAETLGTRRGLIAAVSHTGAVITSAGLVLAGVFAALGMLPLVTLGQLGLIVGLGVIVDTFLVRTIIVPAIFGILGDRVWWPSRPAAAVESNDVDEPVR